MVVPGGEALMNNKLLLVFESTEQCRIIQRALEALDYHVCSIPADELVGIPVSSRPLAVVQTSAERQQEIISRLRQRRMASKILCLVPFVGQGIEMKLISAGADDVLTLPITRSRLEATIHNLMRLHQLEGSAHISELQGR